MTARRILPESAFRVRLTCAFDGDGSAARELPFVVAVVADLAAENVAALPPLSRREFVEVTERSFDAFMDTLSPRLTLSVADCLGGQGELGLTLEFRRLADFGPEALAQRIPRLRALVDLRTALAAARRRLGLAPVRADGADGGDEGAPLRLAELADPSALPARGAAAGDDEEGALLNKRATLLADAVPAAARAELADMLDRRLVEIDERIGAQLDAVLHCPAFQRLEATWRGLSLLAGGVSKGTLLKIKALSLSMAELREDLGAAAIRTANGEIAGLNGRMSSLYDALYTREYGQHGGEPFGVLLLDHDIDATQQGVDLLALLAAVGLDAHMPVLAAAAPEMAGFRSFADLGEAPAVSPEQSPFGRSAEAWREFRGSEAARYVGLAAPRVAARQPYRRDTQRSRSFQYEETVVHADDRLWISAAYLLARRICAAFARYGWCVAFTGLAGGGGVADEVLPADFGLGDEMRAPSPSMETQLTEAQEQALEDAGLIVLSPAGGQSFGVFHAARSPYARRSGEAGALAQLPYTFAVSRVAHYLKVMTRESIGRSQSRTAIEMDLNRWLARYVTYQDDASLEARAQRPLREGSVTLSDAAGQPGCYLAEITLVPHYQLEEINFSLKLKTLLQPGAG